MNIKKKSFILNNVIRLTKTIKTNDISQISLLLREIITDKKLYPTSPIIYQRSSAENEGATTYSFYVAVDQPVAIHSKEDVAFLPTLKYEQGLCIRHMTEDNDFSKDYWLLEECAKQNKIHLIKPYYHVLMNVYGETITDVFAPIQGENI